MDLNRIRRNGDHHNSALLRGDPNVKEQFSEIIDTWSVGNIVHRNGDFSVGALMRILPGFITYFVLGSSFADPRNLTLVFMSFFVDILVAKWMKVRKKNGEG